MPESLGKNLPMKVLAEESAKTKKAREKLKQQLIKTQKKLTPEALEKKSQEISQWIERHSSDRLAVQKDISLFDQNRNSAKMSRNIEKLAEELAIDLQKSKEVSKESEKK